MKSWPTTQANPNHANRFGRIARRSATIDTATNNVAHNGAGTVDETTVSVKSDFAVARSVPPRV